MAMPNWTAIFTVREDLRPPGYDETFVDMQERPWVPPKQRQRGKEKQGRFPGLKHGSD